MYKHTRHVFPEMTILFLKNNKLLQIKPVDRTEIHVSYLITPLPPFAPKDRAIF